MKENITFWIAAAGFVMSASSWVYTFIAQKKSLSFRITEASCCNDTTVLFLQIENNSRLPISITRIVLNCNSKLMDCVSPPVIVREDTRKCGSELIERKTYYSMQIPIPIDSLGAVSGYVAFQGDQCNLEADSKSVNLVIYTNRGKAMKTTLEIPQAPR
jgi:hypothetical protein